MNRTDDGGAANRPLHRRIILCGVGVLALAIDLAPGAVADRTHLKPGWNLFSPQQDIQIGGEVAKQADSQLPMLKDKKVDDYLDRLGHRLAAKAPGEKYPYQFKAVNDPSINAFALPGGYLFVNRGTIEAADNEAQLAGVIGHEIGHVALRHGTNQMSKASLVQLPLAAVGGLTGSGSVAGLLSRLGVSFAASSLLLKYSRDAERQADLVGTQILYDNNYDPRAMAQFFEKLNDETKKDSKTRPIQFFSDHPNPENRVTAVNAEVDRMGGHPGNYRADPPEFHDIQQYVRSLPPPPKQPAQPARAGADGTGRSRPQPPSAQYQDFQNSSLSMRYPGNWRSYGRGDAFTLAPDGGFVDDGRGNTSLAYGAMMAVFQPRIDTHRQIDLESATDQLLDNLHNSNPRLRITRDHSPARVAGQRALSTMLANESPVGGNEVDWLVTILQPDGLTYFVFVSPEPDFRDYQRAFEDMVASIRLARR